MQVWCSLPNEVRNRFRVIFEIPRSRSTEVNDGVIISDGTTYEDLKKLSTEKMQVFLDETSTDFHKLFDKTVAKITEELIQEKQPKVIVTSETPITVIIDPPKKRGRPSKTNA